MAIKGRGLNPTLSPNFILGYSDTETVKLDFDKTPFRVVKYWAERTSKWFELDGYLILKSSEESYHVVFNRSVSWAENLRVVAWVYLHSHHRKLLQWLLMQIIKKSSTLRMSVKRDKPSPRVVFHCGRQDNQIRYFLEYRMLIKRILTGLGAA